MRVLGIDPGSTVTGLGVIELQRGRYVHVASSCVRTFPDQPMASRLVAIHAGVGAMIDTHLPDSVAIEQIFSYKSAESALRLGQARGVALLAAGQRGYTPAEYNPSTIKASVGAHGKADKEAVAKLVCLLLGLREGVSGPADITDALAIAITHMAHERSSALRRTESVRMVG